MGQKTGGHDVREAAPLAVGLDAVGSALAAREQALSVALESTWDAVAVFDREWRCTYMNGRAKTLGGRDFVGQIVWDVYPEAVGGPFHQAYHQAIRTGSPVYVEGYGVGLDRYIVVNAYPSETGLTLFIRDMTEQQRLAASLRERERLFQHAFEKAAVGVVILADDRTTLEVNDEYCRIIGRTREEALALKRGEITHPDDREAQGAAWEPLLAGQVPSIAYEKRYLLKDGETRWVSVSVSRISESMGTASRFLCVLHDLTKRKRDEAALRESEDRLRTSQEAGRVGGWDWDLRTNRLYFSDMNCRLYGLDPADRDAITLETWRSMTHPDDLARMERKFREDLENRVATEAEYRIVVNGEVRWLQTRSRLIFDDEGAPVRKAGINIDITERKTAEWALREGEERLSFALAAARAGFWESRIDTGEFIASDQALALYGLPPETRMTHELALAATFAEDHPRVEEAIEKVRRTGGPFEVEVRSRHPDGSIHWVHSRATLRNENGSLRLVGLVQDVTERKEAERALRESERQGRENQAALLRLTQELEQRVLQEVAARETAQARAAHSERVQALGQLAGGIAHDFNNILQAVQGGAALIERSPHDPESVRRLARLLIEAADRGSSITRRLLSFARRADLRLEPIDAVALLADMGDILGHTLGAGVEVRVDAPPGLAPLLADKGQLETVLVNLATNARDAMAESGLLTLSARQDVFDAATRGDAPERLKPGAYIRLCVRDNGAGMAPEVLARVTEPFFTTKEPGQGTGLGLAMAHGFAEQSGGALSIDSAPGRGTTVSLWFPVASAETQAALSDNQRPSQIAGGPARLIVVDDEPVVLALLCEQLTGAGYSVLPLVSGAQALAALDEGEDACLLVSDLSMPDMNGVALIREAHRRRPRLPAILLTGFATSAAEIALAGAMSGSVTLLRKPIRNQEFLQQVAVLLESAGAGGAN